jgi:hypothetical protein
MKAPSPTWLAYPLFNLMLRLNRYGKHILTKDQKRGATSVGVCLLGALGLLAYGLIENNEIALLGAVVAGFYMLVLAGLFIVPVGTRRYAMSTAAIAIAGVAVYAFWQMFPLNQRNVDLGLETLKTYFGGILAFSIASNWLASMRQEQ